jgi:Ser/Thr protein kinase RdoA (MazF antagonist)
MPIKKKPIEASFFNFDENILFSLTARYGLDEIESLCPLLLDSDLCSLLEVRSETCRKMVIETAQSRYFLKQIPWYCDEVEQITLNHRFQEDAHKAGIPIARILPTIDGQTWVSINGTKFVLFEYRSGRLYQDTTRQMIQAAETLARLHKVWLPLPIGRVPAAHQPEDIFDLVFDHIGLVRQVVAPSLLSEIDAILATFTSYLESAKQRCVAQGWSTLPVVMNHGDYNPWNLLFSEEGEVSAVLDFDNCSIGTRLHDVAEALLSYCLVMYQNESTSFAPEIRSRMDISKATAFLAGYNAVLPLELAERCCLNDMLGVIFVELCCLGFIRGNYTPDLQGRMRECLQGLHEFRWDLSRS